MDITKLKIETSTPLKDLIAVIQASGSAACALVFDGDTFSNLLTDGDVRRALMHYGTLEISAAEVLARKQKSHRAKAIVAIEDSSADARRALFQRHNLRQLLIVNGQGTPVDVITHEDIQVSPAEIETEFYALIMAGGFGMRMRPLTYSVPKPMLPINGIPLMQLIVDKLVAASVRKIYVSTHYLSEVIVNHFGDGTKFGIQIEYLDEPIPLGTGGCLTMIKDASRDVLIINGDILTELDLRMFFGNHFRTRADLSIATSIFSVQVPYGVVNTNELNVVGLCEKPTARFLINSGIYVVSPAVLKELEDGQKFDITQLIEKLIVARRKVVQFPIFERWLDIGRIEDYKIAQET